MKKNLENLTIPKTKELRQEKLDEAVAILKSEFVGLDDIIDNIKKIYNSLVYNSRNNRETSCYFIMGINWNWKNKRSSEISSTSWSYWENSFL